MSNYLIDASVYALPKRIPDVPDAETVKSLEEYLESLNKLFELISSIDKNFKVNHFLFCKSDIGLLIDNKLFLDTGIKNTLRNIKLQRKYKVRLDDLEKFMLNEIMQLRWAGQDTKPEKLCTIEAYLGVDGIEVEESNRYTPDITKEISNTHLSDNLKKNISTLTFLNNKVYKNHNITRIITNAPENECTVEVSIQKIKHNFNNIECHDIIISNCNIINCNLQTLKRHGFSSIDVALENAKNDFKDTIEYSDKINESITEYKNILAKLRSGSGIDGIVKIDNFKKEYPVIVYDCLDILDKLVKFYRVNGKPSNPQPLSKKIKCDLIGKNKICDKCCGYLRICGFDCSKENEKLIIDGKHYQIHLKPYTKMEGTNNSEKSLRIYFSWDTDKIEVGYIGKHL
jgi:hypothetical protein